MRFSTFLEVNLGHLGENFARIQALAPSAEILPMVKTDAYGNGVLAISKFLINECGCKILGTATLGEALHISQELPNLKVKILVFSDSEIQKPEFRKHYLNGTIIPVLHQKSDLEVIKNDPDFNKLPIYLKLNTGMNRLGLTMEDLEIYLPFLKQRGVEHLMSHFARSAQIIEIGDKSHKQVEEFQKMKKFLLDAGVEIKSTSLANSGAIENKFAINETYVRPGLMLYGPPSVTHPMVWKGHQISRLVTKVLSSFQVKKGTPVGYGVNVADKDSFMAVIPIGYGDGFMTFFSGTKLSINGIEGRVFGRINMDLTYIQFDPSAEAHIKNEDVLEIWNHDNKVITDLATQNKTIPYQLMCGISGRIPRIYKVQ
jgi:alanine racemase